MGGVIVKKRTGVSVLTNQKLEFSRTRHSQTLQRLACIINQSDSEYIQRGKKDPQEMSLDIFL